jgi:hypothetical protein
MIEDTVEARLIEAVDGCRLDIDQCDLCGGDLVPEHAHSRCTSCGYIRPCCGW